VQSFDRPVLITLRDKLGQTISGAIAQHTGKWFKEVAFDLQLNLTDRIGSMAVGG